jgi:two-component system sensor histidine kinase DegS
VTPRSPYRLLISLSRSLGIWLSALPANSSNVLERLIDILSRADIVARESLEQMTALVEEAQSVADETAQVRSELEQFLEQFALESGMIDGGQDQMTFAGGVIDLNAMRSDVAIMALNAAKAQVLTASLKSLQACLASAARHFKLDTALTSTLDARDEAIQMALTAVREDERRKLSREIHDGPAQVLANAVYHVQIIEQVLKRNPAAIEEDLTALRELLKEGVTEVRRFMFGLSPIALHEYGLGPTLTRWVEDWGRFYGHHVKCTLEYPLPKLTPEQDLAVFRIVQQSLQNIHQHAGNDASVEVSVATNEELLIVRIADNGNGFDPALVSPKLTSGAGLRGMRERAEVIHASLSIESRLGHGSVITLIIAISPQIDLDDDLGVAVLV